MALVVWDEEAAPLADVADHPRLLRSLWEDSGVRVRHVPIDLDKLSVLTGVAGPVTAFSGAPGSA